MVSPVAHVVTAPNPKLEQLPNAHLQQSTATKPSVGHTLLKKSGSPTPPHLPAGPALKETTHPKQNLHFQAHLLALGEYGAEPLL